MVGGRGPHVTAVLVAPGSLEPGRRLELPEEEAHHLRVRRATTGQAVRLLDGAGGIGEGMLAALGPRWAVTVGAVRLVPPPPALVLAVGAGDRERFALVVEKAAELGATAVIPLETDRSRNVAGRVRPGHLERLRQRGREALKQCSGAWAPDVSEPTPLDVLLAGAEGARWVADGAGDLPPALGPASPVTVAVGPEGGLTEGERERLAGGGFAPVRLGPRILRFETAAIAALVAVQLRRGTLEAQ